MSNNPTTQSVVDLEYTKARTFRKTYLRTVWIPIVLTLTAVLDALSRTDDLAQAIASNAVFVLLIWTAQTLFVDQQVDNSKYRATAAKLDEVLKAKDGRWEKCADAPHGYSVHFGDDPHRDAEVSEDDIEDTEK